MLSDERLEVGLRSRKAAKRDDAKAAESAGRGHGGR